MAFAVIAAQMLPLASLPLAVAAAWAVNQAIDFGALHYLVQANTILWALRLPLPPISQSCRG